MRRTERFRTAEYLLLAAATAVTLLVCVSAGSVPVRLSETAGALSRFLRCLFTGEPQPQDAVYAILIRVRLPRVLAAALIGASLSLCGGAMQGLLRNPLADGSTLGVSSGAALGAVLAIAFGVSIPGFPDLGVAGMAMLFAFVSLLLILTVASRLDGSLSTNTILLVGVIFSMLASSFMSLVITFSGEHLRGVVFWTMGSLSGVGYRNAAVLLAALVLAGSALLLSGRALNAFAVGEDNARHIGVNVRRVKLIVLIAVSALTGVCVSVGGTIGFVGLIVPHMTRLLTGPNHRRLMPASLFFGAIFLMLCDLAARTVVSPIELPIGVVTSLIGAALFLFLFYSSRKAG